MDLVKRPNYLHYSRLDEINVSEAIWLITYAQMLNIDDVDTQKFKNLYDDEKVMVRRALTTSIELEDVGCLFLYDGKFTTDDGDTIYDYNRMYILTYELCEWAIEKKYHLPDELKALVPNATPVKAEQPPKASGMQWFVYDAQKLDSETIKYWSRISCWSMCEGIMLSMGYVPKLSDFYTSEPIMVETEMDKLDENTRRKYQDEMNIARKIGNQEFSRRMFIERALKMNDIPRVVMEHNEAVGTTVYGFKPIEFSKWAVNHLPTFPQELFDAVMTFRGTEETPTEPKATYEPDSKTIDAPDSTVNEEQDGTTIAEPDSTTEVEPDSETTDTQESTANEVTGSKTNEAPQTPPSNSEPVSKDSVDEKTVCASEYKAKIDTELDRILNYLPYLRDNDAVKNILKEWNGYSNAGAQRLWGPRVPILVKAVIYMDSMLKGEPPCRCRHDKLGAIAYENATDGINGFLKKYDYIIDEKSGQPKVDEKGEKIKSRFGLKSAFKDLALLLVPEERRLGGNDKDKSSLYDAEACICKVPEHQ